MAITMSLKKLFSRFIKRKTEEPARKYKTIEIPENAPAC